MEELKAAAEAGSGFGGSTDSKKVNEEEGGKPQTIKEKMAALRSQKVRLKTLILYSLSYLVIGLPCVIGQATKGCSTK